MELSIRASLWESSFLLIQHQILSPNAITLVHYWQQEHDHVRHIFFLQDEIATQCITKEGSNNSTICKTTLSAVPSISADSHLPPTERYFSRTVISVFRAWQVHRQLKVH